METSEACPMGRLTSPRNCSVEKCQYRIRGNCEFSSCQSIIGEDNREKRLRMTSELYQITVPELQSRAHDVMIAILLNGFFEHVFNKPILDCKKAELEALRKSEAQFYAWRKKERPKFSECLRVLDIIETNL